MLSHQVQLLNVLSQTFDPKKYISVEMAPCHLYLKAYHDLDDKPVLLLLDLELFEFGCTYAGKQAVRRPWMGQKRHSRHATVGVACGLRLVI